MRSFRRGGIALVPARVDRPPWGDSLGRLWRIGKGGEPTHLVQFIIDPLELSYRKPSKNEASEDRYTFPEKVRDVNALGIDEPNKGIDEAEGPSSQRGSIHEGEAAIMNHFQPKEGQVTFWPLKVYAPLSLVRACWLESELGL
jgi:hypothetical protein